jgi:hypothetical protein
MINNNTNNLLNRNWKNLYYKHCSEAKQQDYIILLA